eukprot:CAMPEP_0206575124 /NCGR_PEP_ID=MMETSP0325_2-20121206/29873_1 /ASSEMBLY_ACC=CAM_ASM_000347 /TAXON_ID=2866 /ORGANISM="Crypthecodinium cohnii, Strain Seligo" /LENGTH=315 /DNA_ID=CAMNT_0054079897 /DNA_START=66 /DNA_END=1011 /DNA_ORIENTATION=+
MSAPTSACRTKLSPLIVGSSTACSSTSSFFTPTPHSSSSTLVLDCFLSLSIIQWTGEMVLAFCGAAEVFQQQDSQEALQALREALGTPIGGLLVMRHFFGGRRHQAHRQGPTCGVHCRPPWLGGLQGTSPLLRGSRCETQISLRANTSVGDSENELVRLAAAPSAAHSIVEAAPLPGDGLLKRELDLPESAPEPAAVVGFSYPADFNQLHMHVVVPPFTSLALFTHQVFYSYAEVENELEKRGMVRPHAIEIRPQQVEASRRGNELPPPSASSSSSSAPVTSARLGATSENDDHVRGAAKHGGAGGDQQESAATI